MSDQPLVTIITPSYNQAAFLEQTIRSVLAQDYQPIEYIIVDGASTDGSKEIIQRFTDHLAWWVSEPDSGQAEAINKGLAQSKGEIVAWLNSDDLYLPGSITQAVRIFQQEPSLGLVFNDAITIDAQGRPLKTLLFDDWGLLELMQFRIICQPAVFMRRSVLEKAGYLDPTFHFMLDHHLWIRMARIAPIQHASKYVSSKFWAAARHHAGAKNVAQGEGFVQETKRLLTWMQAQSDLAPLIANNQKTITGGAQRLQARYLLDSGLPREALKSYGQAFLNWPGYTLGHLHRIVYAMSSLVNLQKFADPLIERLAAHQSHRLANELQKYSQSNTLDLEQWPGIDLV